MKRLLQHTLLGAAGAALLGHWVVAGQAVGAAADPLAQTTSYVVQAEANQPAAEIGHGYFTLSLKGGQTKTVRIIIKNTGKRVLLINAYPADATQIAAGGIDFGTQHTPLKAVGAWMTVQPKDLTLAPGQAQRVTATISMPANATAGDYVGGVAMENKTVQGQGAGSHLLIKVHYRQVIAILDSVPGARSATARIAGVALNPYLKGAEAVVSVRNTGNVLLKGTGIVSLLGSKGAMQQYPITFDSILPAAVAQLPLYLPHLILQPGTYGMSVQVNSVHNVLLVNWKGNVGYLLVQPLAQPTAIKNVVLQPAQGAPNLVARAAAVPQATTASAQSMPVLLLGGGAILVLALGTGLGVIISRRSKQQSM